MISSTSSSLSHEQYLRKKRNKKLFRYGLVFFVFISLVALLSYISHRPQIRISKIELSGGVLVTQDEIESKALTGMSGSYLWLFPKNNSFLYSKTRLEDYLMDNFKRIDTISIRRKNLKTLVIDITERKPVAMWCEGVPTDVQPSGSKDVLSSPERTCYFIDQNSTVFANAPHFSGDAYFRYYGLILNDNPIGKEYMASSRVFTELSGFIQKTKDLLLQPQYLVAKNDGQFSLFVAGGGEIMFDMKESLSKTSDNLVALLRVPALQLNSDGVLPVEYIDLRYGNKLFYKLK